MSRRLAYALVALAAISCSGGHSDEQQQVASPGDAVQRGHEAAWTLSHTDHSDTIALQNAILEARAIHDQYVLTGEDDAAQEFEKAFIDSLRRADPQLAGEIF